MSYGLQVQSFDAGGNEIIQIDTTQGLVQYVVTHRGYGSQVNVGNNFSPRSKILVKPQTETNGNYKSVLTFTGGMTTEYELCIQAGTRNGPTIKFVISDPQAYYSDGFGWNEAFNQVSCDYLIIQDVTDLTPVGDYGLQTLTAGGDTAFDSRKITRNDNIKVDSVIPARSLGGAAGPSDVISNDSSKWIDLSFSFWDTLGTQSGIKVYAGTQQTRYWHKDKLEPLPGQSSAEYYFDNYGVLWLASSI